MTNLTKEKSFTNKLGGSSFSLDSGIVNEPRMFGARARVRVRFETDDKLAG